MKKNILITGNPRSGKSTLLKDVIKRFDSKTGFITSEIREKGERVGFNIETQNGEKSIFASINIKTDFKVSKYFVDIKSLEEIMPTVDKFNNEDLLFLDEIGQMQLTSQKFKGIVKKYLNASNVCIATISKIYSDEFIEEIKKRSDIFLVEITQENREEKKNYVENLLKKIIKAKRYISEGNRFLIDKKKANITTDHGIRKLEKQKNIWICDCDFFQDNEVCSHTIAIEEYVRLYKEKYNTEK
jgi:nucleoside-triphosphatase